MEKLAEVGMYVLLNNPVAIPLLISVAIVIALLILLPFVAIKEWRNPKKPTNLEQDLHLKIMEKDFWKIGDKQ